MVRLGLVVSTYHEPITDRMATIAREAAEEGGADIVATHRVPGTFDTVLPADRLARRLDVDAVAVIGTLVEGETDHDEVIGHAVASQLHAVARAHDTPVTFGVTGPGMTAEEATERVDYAANAVAAAIDLVDELKG